MSVATTNEMQWVAPRGRAAGPGRRRWAVGIVAALVACATASVVAPTAQAAATNTVGFYGMDEAAGVTVLADGSGGNRHGTIGAEVVRGQRDGAITYHHFPYLAPNQPPPHPEHLNRIPDSTALDPEAGDYSVTIRYRTTHSFGNIVQKGQNGTPGGYFKFEAPNGIVSCLFRGAGGEQRTANSIRPLNDGAWHVVKCERTASDVTMYVDGMMVNRLTGPTGTINNSWEVTIGGKPQCDQVSTTCDYFAGDIDYVRIEKGAGGPVNAVPKASFVQSCTMLTCTFDGRASSDTDGQIHGYSWRFGDGSFAHGPTVTKTYAVGGTYSVVLSVVDDRGGIDTSTRSVTVTGTTQSAISFVGRNAVSTNAVSHSVQIPTTAVAGDALILLLSINTAATMGAPSGAGTWTSLGTTAGGFAQTQVWSKVAGSSDPGRTVRIDLSGQSKGSLTLLVYRGTHATNPVAVATKAVASGSSASRTTPVASVSGSGRWVISYWMHGDSATTALTPPAGVASRATGTQTGGGRVTTLAADSNAPVASGNYGGLVATGAAASSTGAAWTIVLAPRT